MSLLWAKKNICFVHLDDDDMDTAVVAPFVSICGLCVIFELRITRLCLSINRPADRPVCTGPISDKRRLQPRLTTEKDQAKGNRVAEQGVAGVVTAFLAPNTRPTVPSDVFLTSC